MLTCWLDILPFKDAEVFPPDDIALAKNKLFEVRVVIWKAKGVPSQDHWLHDGMSDLYVKCWPEGTTSKQQHTDTHWRCKRGEASFNWRMIFDVELGELDHSTAAMKFPKLHIQLWDRGLPDVLVGEALDVDLRDAYKKAFKDNARVNVFGEAADEREKQPRMARQRTTTTTTGAAAAGSAAAAAGGAGALAGGTSGSASGYITAGAAAAAAPAPSVAALKPAREAAQAPASDEGEGESKDVEIREMNSTNGLTIGMPQVCQHPIAHPPFLSLPLSLFLPQSLSALPAVINASKRPK